MMKLSPLMFAALLSVLSACKQKPQDAAPVAAQEVAQPAPVAEDPDAVNPAEMEGAMPTAAPVAPGAK